MCAEQVPGPKDWRELATKAANEADQQKLLEIIQELCLVLDARDQERKSNGNPSGWNTLRV